MNTDSISDMLTRIRNAQAVGHKTVIFPFSKIKFELAKILSAEEFIGAISEKEKDLSSALAVSLRRSREISSINIRTVPLPILPVISGIPPPL